MRICIDPGKTTGVAWRTPDGTIRGIEWPGDAIVVILDGFHSTYGITDLVVENFRSRPGPAVSLSAPVTIGRIQEWADARGIRVVFQEPSAAKRHVDNDSLRERGGWLRGHQHARDAVRHLLYREDRVAGR